MMKLVYRPAPAALRSSATSSTTQTHASSGDASAGGSSNTGAAFCALASVDNGNNSQPSFKYVDQYPIDKHAGPMYIHPKQNTFCGICGMCITLEDEQAVSWTINPYTVTGPDAVQHADAGNEEFDELQRGQDESLDCNSANERTFGVMPKPGWTGMYRAIIRQTKTHRGSDVPIYYISGVGRYHLWDSDPKARAMYNKCTYGAGEPVFTVPRNKEDSLVDRKHFYNKKQTSILRKNNTTQNPPVKRVNVYPCHFHDEENQRFFPHGFPVHDNCWKLATTVIGADKLENNLNSFLAALQQQWEDWSTIKDSRQVANWIVNERGYNNRWYENVASLMISLTEDDVNDILISMCDPIHVEEVEELIAESARRHACMMDEDTDSGYDNNMADSTTMTEAQRFYSLHPEALTEMLDQLHYDDVEAYLRIYKHSVPESYWKKRAPRDIIWELDSIDEQAPLDWQYLCLRAERLCETSFGLINRDRICESLREVDHQMSMPANGQDEEAGSAGDRSGSPVSSVSADTYVESAREKESMPDMSEWEEESRMEDYKTTANWYEK